MKIVWKGSIAFGLVNIPIELYSAIQSHGLGFTLLHADCKTPLKYHRWCPHCKKEVQWDDTVKGIKKSTGKYVIFTQEMLHGLHPEKTETINIIECVSIEQINVLYFNEHYYIAPAKNSNAYALFMAALERLGKVAIGRFVMRNKEYFCILQPYNNYLLLTTLHYAHEIRGIQNLSFDIPARLDTAELKLAEAFITKLSVKKFDISKFKDTFAQEIKALLSKKTKGGTQKTKTKRAKTRKKPTLVESLKESLRTVTQRRPATTMDRQRSAYAKKRS